MDKNFFDTLTKDGYAYLIASADDLCNFSKYVNAGNDCKEKIFKLANNIDLRDVENFTPIGTKKNPFAGTFDGDGKTISNLKIVGKNYVGLFGRLKPDWDKPFGTIKNCTADGNVSGKDYVGGLVGDNYRTIENCTANGNVSGTSNVGGLVGDNSGTIESCTANGNVSGKEEIGGLVGRNNGMVYNCTADGNVSGEEEVSGLIGCNSEYGMIENCSANGDVTGEKNVGGLVGVNSGTIENCSASGNVNVSKRDEII